jgi:hypothetical protein
MIKTLILICSLILVASCSSFTQKKSNGWLSDDIENIERTKKLFACSSFFKIIASQRPQNKQKYNKLSSQTKSYAFNVMPAFQKGSKEVKSELTKKYTVYGNYKSRSWVKEIGKDKTAQRFPQITKDCYKVTQLESLLNTVDDLNRRFDKS